MKNFIRCIFSANFKLCLLTLIFFTVYQAANAQLPDPAKLVGGGTLCPNSPGIRFGITNYTAISHGLHGGYALTYHDPKRGAVLMGTIFPQADAQAGDTLYFNGLFTSEGSYELTVPIFGYGPGLLGYQYIHYKRLTLNQAISQSICGKNDGSLFFSINNADGPAAFALQLPTGQVVKQTDNGNFTGLNAGTYYLRVTDAAGCIINLPNVVVGRDKAVTVSTAATPTVNCSGIAASGSVLASVTGGAPSALAYKYAFLLTSPSGTTDTVKGGDTYTFNQLAAGTYQLRVTDTKNCSSTLKPVVVKQVKALAVNKVAATKINWCNGATGALADGYKGQISVTLSGGVLPYTFTLTQPGGGVIKQANNVFNGITDTGYYQLNVSDASGCNTTVNNIYVKHATAPAVTAKTTPPSCLPGLNGSINLTVKGGVPNYFYRIINLSRIGF